MTADEVATLRRYKGPVETVGRLTLERFEESLRSATYPLIQRTDYHLRIWKGKALKPIMWLSSQYPEKIEEKYHKVVEAEVQDMALKLDRKLIQAKARAALKDGSAVPFPVGTILDHSWGWEQTNVDFYQVIVVKGCTITIQKIRQDTEETGFMSGTTTPRPGEFVGEPIVKVLRPYNEGYHIPMEHGWCDKWNGQPQRCSWYA